MNNEMLVRAAWNLLSQCSDPDKDCTPDLDFAYRSARRSLKYLVMMLDVLESRSDSKS